MPTAGYCSGAITPATSSCLGGNPIKSFSYTLQNEFPMFLGSAGSLAAIADCYPDTTGTLEMGTRRADISRPMRVMSMGVRKGDRVTVSVEGPSEVELFDVLCNHFSCAM